MREPIALPALESNYIWLLPVDTGSGRGAYVIDPGEAGPVLEALEREKLALEAVLLTHHHWDHTNGLDELLARCPARVYGPDSVRQVTQPVVEGDRVELPGASLEVLAVPGHTLDHIAYYQAPETPEAAPRLFCGDALFAGGCGRLFEGTPEMALGSLEKLAQLPPETRIYCAHEYTETNLRFATSVDPQNPAIDERLKQVQRLRAEGRPSLPSELAIERRTNPFLRSRVPGMAENLGLAPNAAPQAVFAELRRRKDGFQ